MNTSKNNKLQRPLEIIPGAISWGILLFLCYTAVWQPVLCAALIISFDFYWILKSVYLTTLLAMAHRKLHKMKNKNWLDECKKLTSVSDYQKLCQLIIFPVYKEGLDILRPSLEALKRSNYPKDKLIVVVAFEERNPKAAEHAKALEEEFKNIFFAYLSTFHPDGIAGEARTKGANATWAAIKAKELLDLKAISSENVIVSCFDADTCVEKEYFGCLSYHYLTNPNPHQASYQPMPMYNNNIWYAPSFARIVEMSSSFWEMIDSMRVEKFITFSSHSMSFKTLVDIGYWPVDMISDDSLVYWKAYLHYNGEYRVVPMYITVSMDAAYSTNFFKTILMQYRQKRRWAWGIENFPFVIKGFLKNREIPITSKIRKASNLLESNISWAVWAFIIMIVSPLPLMLGGALFSQTSISHNLPKLTGILFKTGIFSSIIWIVLSRAILPPRPKDVKWFKNIVMILEWSIVPFVVLILGSTPALDAQTRMMLGKYMQFNVTEKTRKNGAPKN